MNSVYVKALKTTGVAFCKNTSQHGFNFIFLPKRTLLEKCLWWIIILISVSCIVIYSFTIYKAYVYQPIEIWTDTTHHRLWHFHFPAVTVCSANKISLGLVEKHLDLFKDFGNTSYTIDTFRQDLRYLYQLIYPSNKITFPSLPKLQHVLDLNNITAHGLLDLLSPKCDFLLRCKWKGDARRCVTLFRRVLTVYGFCCSFNYFAENTDFTKTPKRVSQCSYKGAFQILLDTKPDDYGAFDMKTFGFNIFVHYPYDYVDWTTEFVLMPQLTTHFITVTPSLIQSSDSLKEFNPITRKCLLLHERSPNGFGVYTRKNCVHECRMRIILEKCGCLPFYHNLLKGITGDNRTCNLIDSECIYKITNDYITSKLVNSNGNICNCPDDCDYTHYNIEFSGGAITTNRDVIASNLGNGIPITNQSSFRLYFGSLVYIKKTRDFIFDFATILAFLGGILGLFNGISIMSLIETFYWLVINYIRELSKIKEEESKKQGLAKTQKKNVFFVDFQN